MQIVIVALIIFGNTLTIVAIVKFQFLRTVTNIFTVSLACSDLLLAFVLPLSAVHRFTDVINVQIHIWVCWLTTVGIISSAPSSLLNLLLIAVDRFVSVIYPFRYDELMTPRRAFVMIACLWTYVILSQTTTISMSGYWPIEYCASTPVANSIIFTIFYIGTLTVSVVGILSLYMCIFCVARKHARAIDVQQTISAGSNAGPNNLHQKRVTKMAAMVLGCFVLCWFPVSLITALQKVCDANCAWLETARKFSMNVVYSNSFMNPIIYAWKNRMFRVAFKRLLGLRWENDIDGI